MPTTDEILAKYGEKIENELGDYNSNQPSYSREYTQFKREMLPETSRYRRWCNTLGNLVKVRVSEKEKAKTQKYLDIAHIDVTPSQVITLALFSLLFVFFGTVLLSVAIFFINGSVQLLLSFLGLLVSLFVFYYAYTMPRRLANAWRLKASSQMVPAILYVVVYMKHTSNLERAIGFASQHLEPPLSLDLKKVFYDVEIGRFSSIKLSLEHYLESWRGYSPEFIEAFHLIESSLYETSESQRVEILEKALQVILDGVYDKMLRYTREIRSPLTNIYMLGIILPTLGLALLPLASTLLQGAIRWHHVFLIFNIIIPFFVFYMTSEVLLKRPGGHGEASVLELNPDYYKFKSKKPWLIALLIALPFLIISLLPFMFQIDFLTNSVGLKNDYTFAEIGIPFLQDQKLFDFKLAGGSTVGPFGVFAVLLSLFLPLSIALFFFVAYRLKTKDLIKARSETKQLENEFTTSLFQLGNRLGDGMPAEIAFSKVAQSTQGQKTQSFFALVNRNMQQLGMSPEQAIFDPKRGAIIYYPSALIATSMRILVESVKKGLKVASRSLMSISEYTKNIRKINERLRDLLAEVVSDMKSNMVFLAPLLAGIVVGLSTMITTILNKLQTLVGAGAGGTEVAGLGSIANITSIFDVTLMIPPYFLQASVGLYIVEIIFILTTTLVTVDSGKDKLREKYELSKNLRTGIILYLITALVSIFALAILANIALGGIA